MSIPTSRQAELRLVLIVLFWGLTFPLIHTAISFIDPIGFVFFRFLLAALILLPLVLSELRKINYSLLVMSLLLGLCNVILYNAQVIGLRFIGPNESAFITSASIIFVPLLSWIFRLHTPRWIEFISIMMGMIGMYYVSNMDHMHALSKQVLEGIGLTLCSSFFIALTIVFTHLATTKLKQPALLLTFLQITFTALPMLLFTQHIHIGELRHVSTLGALLFCSIFATALAITVQSRFQQYTTATKAALIYCLEPVFAVLFSFFLFDIPITRSVLLGGSMIIVSILLPDVQQKIRALLKRFA